MSSFPCPFVAVVKTPRTGRSSLPRSARSSSARNSARSHCPNSARSYLVQAFSYPSQIPSNNQQLADQQHREYQEVSQSVGDKVDGRLKFCGPSVSDLLLPMEMYRNKSRILRIHPVHQMLFLLLLVVSIIQK